MAENQDQGAISSRKNPKKKRKPTRCHAGQVGDSRLSVGERTLGTLNSPRRGSARAGGGGRGRVRRRDGRGDRRSPRPARHAGRPVATLPEWHRRTGGYSRGGAR